MDQFSRRDNFVVRRARDGWAAIYADLEEGRNIPAHCDARILIVRLRRRRTPKHILGFPGAVAVMTAQSTAFVTAPSSSIDSTAR
jgi:hypothetical protein